jgi:hypothetical protein
VDRAAAVEEALRESGVTWRRVAPGEWGLRAPVGPSGLLDVGLAVRGEMLSAQAEVVGPGVVSNFALLRRNRALRIVRFAVTAAGAVYVQGDLPLAAVSVVEVDRLLGLLVAAADELRSGAGDRGAA